MNFTRFCSIVCFFCLTSINNAEEPWAKKVRTLKPDTTERFNLGFRASEGKANILLVGGGTGHHYPKDFLGTDWENLNAQDLLIAAATPNVDEALELLPSAHILLLSANHQDYGKKNFQTALSKHNEQGGGLVIQHAAIQYNWKNSGFNKKFTGGGAKTLSEKGQIKVIVKKPEHIIFTRLQDEIKSGITLADECLHVELPKDGNYEVLAEAIDPKTKKAYPCIWIVKGLKGKVVCISLGHDSSTHETHVYQTILANSCMWTVGWEGK